ncbi:MAG: CheR family methyltransferase [Thiohalocapsa sp.]
MARNGSLIVGIGASAGGVEALQSLFRTMPSPLGMAFVVVMHLGEGHASALPEIIGRCTKMPVLSAKDNQPVEPDHVYVLASNSILTVQRNRLRLRPQSPDLLARQRHTIDVFLASLAENAGERAVAIILSGLGTDGTLGAKAVKEKGGLTIAQRADHGGPGHPEMPASAISSGAIDLSLAVEEIGPKLAEYRDGHGRLDPGSQPRERRNHIDDARKAICQILLDRVGHNFTGYKERTLLRRVERRMQVVELRGIEAYIERLREDSGEVMQLFNDLLIGVTAFFRDKEAFDALAEKVLPHLFEGKGTGDVVRVWVPGCSTGEEVYSIAIMLLEQQEKHSPRVGIQCFATDIDDAAIAVARAGRYPTAMVRNMPPALLERYFIAEAETVAVGKRVRDVCMFSSHSVIRDPPFSRIDLISCRNLLIYFDNQLQNQLIPTFHYALRPGGYLFLGVSENLSRHSDYFTTIDSKHRIFQRRDDAARHGFFPVAIAARYPSRPPPQAIGLQREGLSLRQSTEKRVLERFAPAHVVVNRNGDILHYSGRTGKYLENALGAPSRQLVSLARRGLRIDLPAALAEAIETNRPVVRHGINVEMDDVVQTIDLTIEPLTEQDGEPAFLVIFSDVGPPRLPGESPAAAAAMDSHDVEQLESDLRDTRERLQSLIEEYETAIEELKSANEELISTNEELQSTNEELETSREETQSINEELHSVNSELQRKVEELDRANEDLRALFDNSPIGMVFLDRSLTIQTFTSAVTRIFNLLPGDRGRPLTDITHDLVGVDLRAELDAALLSHQPRECRVTRHGGGSYLMRIQPDRSGERLLVSFTEISAAVAAEQRQRE